MPPKQSDIVEPVGLIGLGLMGRGIASCLLAHGCRVIAYNRTASRAQNALGTIEAALQELVNRKVVRPRAIADWRDRVQLVRSPRKLAASPFIVESVKEDLDLKRRIYEQIEQVVAPDAVIASNTSSFPVALLQKGRRYPDRFIVMHWAEPAWITRFLEIVRGENTSDKTLRMAKHLGARCGKHPTVLSFDIRGFIANRLMYAFIREACHLVDIGVADPQTIDETFRNDVGLWSTLAGPFRWMDLTGIHSYGLVMKGLLPELSDGKHVPKVLQEMIRKGARGISNRKGFYRYSHESAKAWEKAWVDFTFDAKKLKERYERRLKT
jgi:3-hydroxybutyryl-CoA dehydrogenase